ncbi:MAG: bifunctional folylpolyglutamate synthase/dihydrofolate synthase [Nocardiopsaceae bacterium]|nr:bifunctional folylpolyglutamate synthase/dihydrofolate synthase [Nocardiopsaceae bacterium]
MTPDLPLAERLREAERDIFSRRPEHKIEPTLDRIADLAGLLGQPQRAYPVVHVTGTNGKTSTARMTEALLRARGLRTGLFTSPHLTSPAERIRIDGEPVSPERFADAYADVAPYLAMVDGRQPVPLSFFEVLTGMAFAAFADAPVDVAVLEVGLGGTWDATNVADGAVAVITPVAIDHTSYLGDTLTQIAGEKAGIIKPGAVAVLAHQEFEAAEVLLQRAADVGATVAREGLEFGVAAREIAVGGQLLSLQGLRGSYDEVLLPVFGSHQAGNAACALATAEAFGGSEPLGADLVREAFAQVSAPGRLELVRRSPSLVVDAAHNPAGMAATVAGLIESFGFPTLIGVLAVSEDKDVPGILGELEPAVSQLVVTRSSSDRSMDPAKLAELAAAVLGPERVRAAARLDDAIEIAVELADEASGGSPADAGVLITGSVVTAGDARRLLGGGPA